MQKPRTYCGIITRFRNERTTRTPLIRLFVAQCDGISHLLWGSSGIPLDSGKLFLFECTYTTWIGSSVPWPRWKQPRYSPTTGFRNGVHPKWRCMKVSSCKTCLTLDPAWIHSPFSFQYPPLRMCFKHSMDANLFAKSRLGAKWLLNTKQSRKIAL